jgi:transcriptional regulator with XRE-family HTH domain
MTENVEGIRGEFRRFTAVEIGFLIKVYRKNHGVKRAALAADANMSEKTLERAEKGEGIAEDSLRRIARALGFQETVFTAEHYIPAPEEAARMAEEVDQKLRQTHRSVAVSLLIGVRDVHALFEGCALVADDSNIAEEHLEQFTAIKESLVDWSDVASDVPPTMALAGAKDLLKSIQEFETLGYVVKCGKAKRFLKGGPPLTCSVLVAFKRPKGSMVTPDEVWLPNQLAVG